MILKANNTIANDVTGCAFLPANTFNQHSKLHKREKLILHSSGATFHYFHVGGKPHILFTAIGANYVLLVAL